MNNYRKNRSILQLVMLFVLSLTMAWTMIPGMFGTGTAYAAEGDTPNHAKNLIKNPDGTYTIALSVTGDAEKVTEPVNTNVIVILDTSGSMNENTGNTEVTYTPSNQNANNMYGTNDGGQTYFRIYRRGNGSYFNPYYYTTTPNGNTRYTGQRYLRQEANQTRLEAAQDAINDLAEALLSKNGQDGNPSDLIQMALVTFDTHAQVSRTPTTSLTAFENAVNGTNAGGGTNWEAALTTANGVNFNDQDQTFVIFVSDGNPTFRDTRNGVTPNDWSNYYNAYGTGQETAANIGNCYPTAVTAAQTIATKVTAGNFFTIGAYGNVDRMESLTTDAGAPAANYFSAENTAALQEALASILEKIEMAGIADVGISDGTTDEVTVESSTAHLLNVDTSSFKYYRAGGVDEEDNVKYDPDANTATTADGKTLKLGEEWAGAPEASYEDSTVDWDLTDVGVLENEVTYTVTFDCWPSQDTLDYLADIENGLYDTLPAAAKEYIDEDGNLDTNTVASLSYKDTRTGETGGVDYDNPDPVTSDAVEQLAVAKRWQNDVDSQSSAPITLDVTRDGTHKYDLTLSSANDWQGNIFISIGMMRTGENGDMEILAPGHDFTFVEPEDIGYRWELDIPVVHPMLIDGTLTMLIKVDKDHQPGSAKTYTIGGATYYVGSTGTANLTATNYRRSQLVLTKTVIGENVPSDATFPFTMTVKNSKASEGTAGDTHSDKYVWFAIMDSPDADESNIVEDAKYIVSGATAEIGEDGNPTYWYYAESEATISVNIPDGYAVRFINLPKDSEYTFAEGTLATGFKFDKAELTTGEDDGFEGGQTSTGTVVDWNSEYEVTYTNEYVLTDVTVTKAWDDNSNQDGLRPTSLTLTLNGVPTGTTVPTPSITGTDGDEWTYTWTGLPKYDSTGTAISYTVTEGTVPEGYTCETTTVDNGGTITNKHTPATTSIDVEKRWVGPAGSEVTVTLYADDKATEKTVKLNANNQWKGTFSNLPVYSSGTEIVYSVVEAGVSGVDATKYSTAISGSAEAGFVITNTNTEKVNVVVKKAWDDNSNQDGLRPTSLTLTLNGVPTGTTVPTPSITGTDGDEWTYTWTGLPKYDSTGTAISYTVTEGTVPEGYTCETTTVDNGGTITNKHDAEKTTVTVKKTWVGPEATGGAVVHLLADGTDTGKSITLSSSNNNTYTFEDLDKNAVGEAIEYTVTEDSITNYRTTGPTGTGTAEDPFEFTNTNAETVDVIVTKVWDDNDNEDGIRPDSLELTLTAPEGIEVPEPTIEKNGSTWTYTWSELPKYPNGAEFTYEVSEETIPAGYKMSGSPAKDGETITNKHTSVNAQIAGLKVLENYSGNIPTGKFFFTISGKSYVPANEEATADEETPADQSAAADANSAQNEAPAATDSAADTEKSDAAQDAADEAKAESDAAQDAADEAAAQGSDNAEELQKAADDAKAAAEEAQTVADEAKAEEESAAVEANKEAAELTEESNTETKAEEAVTDAETAKSEAKSAGADDGSTEIPLPKETKITNDAEGTIAFGDIKFTEPGKYTYEITESGSMDNVTNDPTSTREVVVTVTEDAEGNLTATVDPSGTYKFTFTNTYEPPHDPGVVSIDPPVKKVVEGSAPKKAETYTFQLKAADPSNPMPEAAGGSQTMTMSITGEGEKEFGVIEFTEEGIYDYTITEVAGSNSNCEYDSTTYTVRATVTADEDGKLQLTREYFRDGESVDVATFEFVNTYTEDGDIVKTGDNSNLLRNMLLLVLAALNLTEVVKLRRRRDEI